MNEQGMSAAVSRLHLGQTRKATKTTAATATTTAIVTAAASQLAEKSRLNIP